MTARSISLGLGFALALRIAPGRRRSPQGSRAGGAACQRGAASVEPVPRQDRDDRFRAHEPARTARTPPAIVERLYKEYGPRGFQPLGVAFNDNASLLVPDFVKMLGLSYPVARRIRRHRARVPPTFLRRTPLCSSDGLSSTAWARFAPSTAAPADDFLKGDIEKHIRDQIEALLKGPAPRLRKSGQASVSVLDYLLIGRTTRRTAPAFSLRAGAAGAERMQPEPCSRRVERRHMSEPFRFDAAAAAAEIVRALHRAGSGAPVQAQTRSPAP